MNQQFQIMSRHVETSVSNQLFPLALPATLWLDVATTDI